MRPRIVPLDEGGTAPVLSANVPEPTSYRGRNIIQFDFPSDYFKAQPSYLDTREIMVPYSGLRVPLDRLTPEMVARAIQNGFADRSIFPNVVSNTGIFPVAEVIGRSGTTGGALPSPGVPGAPPSAPTTLDPNVLTVERIMAMAAMGKRLNVSTNMYGAYAAEFIDEPKVTRPRLLLVEIYGMSSFHGAYGVGRTLKTLSLLPGEKTKITMKTFRKDEKTIKASSSVLDSFTSDSSNEFENSVQNEQSDKHNTTESQEYHFEAEAEASWGWGSAKASGGMKNNTSDAHEDFTKNVNNALQKHASKSSAKRDITINDSTESMASSTEENAIEREIQNINVSRTLNFVFRQMNQEFVTLLHLMDVRVGFFNGWAESKREVSLSELDSLLNEVFDDKHPDFAKRREEAVAAVLRELQRIYDYQDEARALIEKREVKDTDGKVVDSYYRVKRHQAQTYKDPVTGVEFTVPGIIVSVSKNVLRTEGVMVDALLGHGDALDKYSHGLQDETVRQKSLANDLTELERTIVATKDETAAKIYASLKTAQQPPKAAGVASGA